MKFIAHKDEEVYLQERGKIVSMFLRNNSSVAFTQRKFRRMCKDFFLWGYLKALEYVNHLQTLQQLKNNIQHEIEKSDSTNSSQYHKKCKKKEPKFA